MSIKDLSVTAASNNASAPYGAPEGLTLANVNNVMRQTLAEIRTLAAEDTIASATTCDLGTKDATFLTVSGTTTITGFGTVSAGIYKFVKYSGALTLTHNATSLILLTGANRTTVAGDCQLIKSEGSGNWREYFYSSAPGSYQPLDTQLTDIAALTPTDSNIIVGNGTTWVAESGATARTSLGLAIGTDVQAYDATLAALASALTAANKIPYATALNTLGELDFKDEDNMASDSATALPSQQSVKAYVDSQAGGLTLLDSATPSGTTYTVSGLTLTDYKALYISMSNVSVSVTDQSGSFGGLTLGTIASAAGGTDGQIWVDLATGFMQGAIVGGAYVNGATGYITSSTSVAFAVDGGVSFDGGTIAIYGVK
jgi:hypothetical protein